MYNMPISPMALNMPTEMSVVVSRVKNGYVVLVSGADIKVVENAEKELKPEEVEQFVELGRRYMEVKDAGTDSWRDQDEVKGKKEDVLSDMTYFTNKAVNAFSFEKTDGFYIFSTKEEMLEFVGKIMTENHIA